MKELGYGRDYRNPHRYEGDFVAEEYLPEQLRGEHWYQPSGEGYEKMLRERLDIWEQRKRQGHQRKKRGGQG